MRSFLDDQIAALPALLELDGVDAVLYDIGGFAGRVAAHHWGVPAIQLSPTYVAWEGYEEDMAEFTTALKTSESGRRYFAPLREWLDANGMSISGDDFLGRPEACVVLIPRVIQPNEERVARQFVFAGPCIDETRTSGWTPAPDDDRPLVYVSFGTSYTDLPDLYARIVRELGAVVPARALDGQGRPGRVRRRSTPRACSRSSTSSPTPTSSSPTPAWAGPSSRSGSASRPSRSRRPSTSSPTPPSSRRSARACSSASGRSTEAVRAALACAPRARELRESVRAGGGTDKAADAVERINAGWTRI